MSLDKRKILRVLRRHGFDRSRARAGEEGVYVACSQCEALVINGVACHETGCPNKKAHDPLRSQADSWGNRDW